MYERELKVLVEKYGLNKSIAQEILASHTPNEIQTIMDFLENYGHMISVK